MTGGGQVGRHGQSLTAAGRDGDRFLSGLTIGWSDEGASVRYRLRRDRHQGRAGRPRARASSRRSVSGSRRPRRRPPTPWPRCSSSCSRKFPGSRGPVGVTVPGVVRHGVVHSAANIDEAWIGTDADALFTEATGRDVHVVNDADAAGLAEARYGAAKGQQGLVIVTTLGDRHRLRARLQRRARPNSELGHLEIDGHEPSPGPPTARGSMRTSRGAVGPAAHDVLPDPREALLPRPVRRGRRDQQVVRGLPAADRHRDRDRAGHLLNRAGVIGAALYAVEELDS